ncbi:hypothetical protein [Paucibacter soli]|uniref:hypothetical protein n=1 Tax=Paucibacter soli TaxID=3133433 RepID=UPI003098B5D7
MVIHGLQSVRLALALCQNQLGAQIKVCYAEVGIPSALSKAIVLVCKVFFGRAWLVYAQWDEPPFTRPRHFRLDTSLGLQSQT